MPLYTQICFVTHAELTIKHGSTYDNMCIVSNLVAQALLLQASMVQAKCTFVLHV